MVDGGVVCGGDRCCLTWLLYSGHVSWVSAIQNLYWTCQWCFSWWNQVYVCTSDTSQLPTLQKEQLNNKGRNVYYIRVMYWVNIWVCENSFTVTKSEWVCVESGGMALWVSIETLGFTAFSKFKAKQHYHYNFKMTWHENGYIFCEINANLVYVGDLGNGKRAVMVFRATSTKG